MPSLTDIHPTLERITIVDIEGALRRLTTDYVLPDGTEAIDGRAVRAGHDFLGALEPRQGLFMRDAPVVTPGADSIRSRGVL